ncbi:hypothetical protein ACJW31_05G040100 [Castanea mollissima]
MIGEIFRKLCPGSFEKIIGKILIIKIIYKTKGLLSTQHLCKATPSCIPTSAVNHRCFLHSSLAEALLCPAEALPKLTKLILHYLKGLTTQPVTGLCLRNLTFLCEPLCNRSSTVYVIESGVKQKTDRSNVFGKNSNPISAIDM